MNRLSGQRGIIFGVIALLCVLALIFAVSSLSSTKTDEKTVASLDFYSPDVPTKTRQAIMIQLVNAGLADSASLNDIVVVPSTYKFERKPNNDVVVTFVLKLKNSQVYDVIVSHTQPANDYSFVMKRQGSK